MYDVDSIDLWLYDEDDRSYTFTIETSTDKSNWTMAVDYSQMPSKSWQRNMTFIPRAAKYVRVIGLSNSKNKWFHPLYLGVRSSKQRLLDEAVLNLPLQKDLLDHTSVTHHEVKLIGDASVVAFEGVSCAFFPGKSCLQIQHNDCFDFDAAKGFTISAWVYQQENRSQRFVDKCRANTPHGWTFDNHPSDVIRLCGKKNTASNTKTSGPSYQCLIAMAPLDSTLMAKKTTLCHSLYRKIQSCPS